MAAQHSRASGVTLLGIIRKISDRVAKVAPHLATRSEQTHAVNLPMRCNLKEVVVLWLVYVATNEGFVTNQFPAT
jgi:hypothetical protein